jgi:tetratricopeptide (TPR) repeat protein
MHHLNAARWAELDPLLDELLTLPPLEQSRRLDALAANDPATAGQLRALLDARDAASHADFLGGVAHQPLTSQTEAAGEVLGSWTLVDLIGQGGMGSVWRALRSDGRFEGEAAIKLLRAGLVDGIAQERFRREGALLAKLNHPGIAKLLDAGITARSQPYLVLELVRGQRIDRWSDEHALGIRERIILFVQVLDAVAAAHSQLVIHRDLKPSNILIDESGRVKLLDFGIAQLIGNESGPGLTREGTLALTPEYAAPEQFNGGSLGMATDVYGLGIVLYQLLTGTHPTGLSGAALFEYVRAASEGTYLPPSERALTNRGELRGDLDNILAKALRPVATERYTTVASFADDLTHFLKHEPISARPESMTYRTGKFVRRHRMVTALGALALFATIAGVTGTVVQAEHAERASNLAIAERDRALKELHFAESINEFVSFLLSEIGGKAFTTVDLMARAEGLLDKQFGKDPGVRARLQMVVAERYGNVGKTEKTIRLFEQAHQSAIEAQDPNLRAYVDCELALELSQQGEAQRAQTLFNDALGIFRQSVPKDVKGLAQCLVHLSMAESQSGSDPLSTLAHADEAILLFNSLPNPVADVLIDAHEAATGAHGDLGHFSQAASELELVLKNLTALGRERSSDALATRQNLGVFLSKGGQSLRAVAVYEDALDIAHGMDSKDFVLPSLLANYAKALIDVGRAREAISLFEKAMGSAILNKDKYQIAVSELQAAPAYREIGDLRRCETLLAQGRKDLMAVRSPTNSMFATLTLRDAELALKQGRTDRVKQLLEQSIEIYQNAKVRNPLAIRALALLARVEQTQGFPTEAKAHLEQSLTWAREASSGFDRSAWMGIALLARAVVLHAQGDLAGAKAALADALPHLDTALGDKAPETAEAHRLELTLRSAGG